MRSKEVDVVQLLIENRDKELNINNIAKLLKKDYKNIHTILNRLAKLQLIKLQPFGRSHRVILINKVHPLIFEAEYLRRKELLIDKNIAVMQDSFRGLRSNLYVLLVFGSYAKNLQTKHSDIDLLFVVPDVAAEVIERNIRNIARTLPLPLHTHVFTETEFKAMKNSRKLTVGAEVITHNVIIHGIEAFYLMIQ